ncbi:MAG: protein kinase [Planctomycetes bacterium]|nr:protein kinase [Planctomycetota bacterium]
MVQIKNVLFGKLAVSTRFITEEQLQECLDFQKEVEERGERPPRLGEILEQKGYLTKQQIQSILETMSSMQRRRFGEIAVAFHFITLEQLETCLDIQKLLQAPQETVPLFGQALVTYRGFLKQVLAGGAHPKVGDVLVAMGYMRNHQVEAVLEEQNKRIVRCKSCEASLNISRFEPGQKIKCGQCNAVLEIVKPEGGEELDVALPTETMSGSGAGMETGGEAAPGEDQPIDPATALMELDKEIKQVRATQQFAAAKSKTPGKIADFQVVTRLGQDATGVIFKATQISKNRPVALKIMNPSVMNDAGFQKKFIDEAKKVAGLEHPNIKKVYSLGKSENRFYIAMEFVEAESVYNVLEKQGKFHFETAVGIALSIAEALQYAQTQGLIHGDVRPSNILILRDGSVKVANLGLATKVSENILAISRSGQMAPFYIAPECVTGDREMDQRTDIYSLGATLFHMIAGRPPFQGQSPFEVLVRLTEETIPPLKFFDPGIPDSVCRVVEKMLEAEPQDRYQTWEELMVELRAVQAAGGAPPTAAPGLPAAGVAPGAAPKPIKTADDAKKEYENRASRSAQMRSVRRGAIVLVVVAVIVGGGLWTMNYIAASDRESAWANMQARFRSNPVTSPEFATRRSQYEIFIGKYPGTPEADDAATKIQELTALATATKAKELQTILASVKSNLEKHAYAAALADLGSGSFRTSGKDDPELKGQVAIIETAAQEDWDKVVETALTHAKNDMGQKAHAYVDDAVLRREWPQDKVEAPKIHAQIDVIRKELAAAKAVQEEEERKKSSRVILDKELKDVWPLMGKWMISQAGVKLATVRPLVHPDHVAEVDAWRERVQWMSDLQANCVNAVNEAASEWDRKHDKANDLRPRQKLSNGLEGRAISSNTSAIVFQDEKAMLTETVAWADLDSRTLTDILSMGTIKGGSTNELHFAFGDGIWLKAEPVSEMSTKIRLMGIAEREYKAASDSGLPKQAAPRMELVAKFFADTKKEFLTNAKNAVLAGRFMEARTGLRVMCNLLPGRLDDVTKEINDGFAQSFLGGAPGGQYTSFLGGVPQELKPTAGWSAKSGVLTGSGKDETLSVDGVVTEVGVLFRMADDRLMLTIELEGAKVVFNPSANSGEGTIGVDYMKDKDEEGKRPLSGRAKPLKMPQISERIWHLLEMREVAGVIEITVDGSVVAMTPKTAVLVSPLGAMTLRLSGPGTGKEGKIDLMGLFTRKK